MPDFREALRSDRVIVVDGAMGTEIYRRGIFLNACYDELCRKKPDLVTEIHESYRAAGAEVLETNSFGASRPRLAGFGLDEAVREINKAAAELARAVAGDELFVAGSIGPLGIRLEPLGPTSRDEARAFFAEQAEALAAGGADLFVLETFSDLNEIREAVAGCRDVSDLPLIAQMTVQLDRKTTYGTTPMQFARELTELGADAIGVNCSVGPAPLLDVVRDMAEASELPISAIPNAGLPQDYQGRKIYMASPEYMAAYARKLVQAGARLIGGCCGTGPDHVSEIANQIRAVSPRTRTVPVAKALATVEDRMEPVPLAERSEWGRRLAGGKKVTSVEILPPRGSDSADMLEACRELKRAGVHAVNVPDGARAMMRMGVLAASTLIEKDVGLETVVHYCCRDRNLLGMMSDLLGAQALGLRNLLIITGDPPKMGPYPEATAVFDIDSIGLTNLVTALNAGLDPGGNAIGDQTSFVVGVGVNPSAVDMKREMERWCWKVEAGAEFAVTQPVFDVDCLVRFVRDAEAGGTRIPIVAGIWPLTSLRNAEFLNNEVPGISVPETILERMGAAQEKGRDHARAEGCAIAREMLAEVRDIVEGVQVSAPFGRVAYALDVLAALEEPSGTS